VGRASPGGKGHSQDAGAAGAAEGDASEQDQAQDARDDVEVVAVAGQARRGRLRYDLREFFRVSSRATWS
jgi:hypothetical protein